ncbi:MAG: MFS transporter [Anaerolineae bacterium]|nr:MFS transporter [Anaerolineae bacterium]
MVNPAIGARSVKQGLWVAKLYYLLFFGGVGCMAPFFNVFLQQKGLSGSQIGWLGSIAPVMALIANPIWGAIADRWQIHRQVLALCALMAGTVVLFFLWLDGFWLFVGLVMALTFFRTPIGAIVDSTVMDLVKQVGGSYGRQRLWGTVGFVLVSFGLGQFLSVHNLSLVFWLHAVLLGIGCVALSFLLPVQSVDQRVSIGQGIRVLMGQRHYVSFLIAVILFGMGMAGYINFLALQILALGGNEQQVGLAWACNALLEIPIMYFGVRWFARYSYRRLILVALVGFVLVWACVGLSKTPGQVIMVVFGSGICFGIYWVAAVGYVSELAPPGLSATAQTLVGAAMSGFGWSLGSVMAGYLWDNFNGYAVFFMAALVSFFAALIFGLGCCRDG